MEGKIIITTIADDGTPTAPANAKTKFVNQIGYIVRENIPISFSKWKAPKGEKAEDHPDVVPDQEKELCWEQLLMHFTLPVGEGIAEKVKHYAFLKMAIAFQTFKKNLKKEFIKKGTTPDFETKYQKLCPHWDAFVRYTLSEERATLVKQNTDNASQKRYFHKMGQGGYVAAIPKWEKMEADLIAKGIAPATLH